MLDVGPSTFQGMRLVINDYRIPNRTLAKDVPVSPEFRVEVNKWMLEFFGSTPLVPDGVVFSFTGTSSQMCNAKTFAMIKNLQLTA